LGGNFYKNGPVVEGPDPQASLLPVGLFHFSYCEMPALTLEEELWENMKTGEKVREGTSAGRYP
jgi:hypothetical protein